MKREILRIDEEKCTGCGLCMPACAEGALTVVNGKVRLISDRLCDGLGACIGECPYDAISIEVREAEAFDEHAVKEHLSTNECPQCPSLRVVEFQRDRSVRSKTFTDIPDTQGSMLSQWPIQLKLLPTHSPIFTNVNLLITADCVPFAYARFHHDFLRDNALVIGCPKLDDTTQYLTKLSAIFTHSTIQSVKVVTMEVPCCQGLYRLVKQAIQLSGKDIPLSQEVISTKGERLTPSTQHRQNAPKLLR